MSDVDLLNRTLERERLARQEAERLLETKSRQLYEAKEQVQKQYDVLVKRNAQIDLLNSIVEFAQSSTDLAPTLQRFVDVICGASGWPVGHVYVVREGTPGEMVSLGVWHLDDPVRFDSFRRVSEGYRFKPGEGLPGRVWVSGEPAWIPDVYADDNFPRATIAKDIGVHTAFGVPIKVQGRVVAVAEFYTGQAQEEDRWLLDVVATTGVQLGSLLQRHESENALDKAHRELTIRNEEMSRFVYTVSHDLKTPLVTMLGFVTLMMEDLRNGRTEELLGEAQRIERAARKMERLIADLLQLSQIGRTESPPQEIDTEALVREVWDSLAAQRQAVGARLEVRAGMPRVKMDRTRLTQVFDNLLTNALKYGCDGGEQRIEVGGEATAQGPRFFVRDFGVGIDPEYHEKIFGLFQRLYNDNRGTGVGLAVVARIMQVCGGRCWVESDPGRGATFVFTLPAACAGGIMRSGGACQELVEVVRSKPIVVGPS